MCVNIKFFFLFKFLLECGQSRGMYNGRGNQTVTKFCACISARVRSLKCPLLKERMQAFCHTTRCILILILTLTICKTQPSCQHLAPREYTNQSVKRSNGRPTRLWTCLASSTHPMCRFVITFPVTYAYSHNTIHRNLLLASCDCRFAF